MGFLTSQVGGAAERSSVSAVSRAFEVPPHQTTASPFSHFAALHHRIARRHPFSADERWLYSRRAILAKCRRLTQEILLRGLGVLRTTMKLTGRPDLGMGEHKYTPGEHFLCDEARWPHKWKWPRCRGSMWSRQQVNEKLSNTVSTALWLSAVDFMA